MHKVYRVLMVLVEEDVNKPLATKTARIHETDIEAGKYMLDAKVNEIWKDVLHVLGKEAA